MQKKFLAGLGIYTEEIRNVEIESTDYNNPGSWHIDKSAKWTSTNTAQVTFDVNSVMKTGDNYKDIILVLDISGSMSGDKLDKAISDSKELVSYVLSTTQNRIAIVTFDSTSTVVSTFSNDKDELLSKLDELAAEGATNYNVALQNVDIVMDGYTKQQNRDVVTLFLTDGYPNEDTPNQVGTYEVLKDKYPYMAINGVQYEMGEELIDEIKEITDSQWVADQSTLNNVLFNAGLSPINYENFIVLDYIHNDYFTISSSDDIKVSKGTVSLTEEQGVPKITWDLGENAFATGGTAKMTINLTLKPQYVESGGFYPTNKKESISYKLPNDTIKIVNTTSTPVIRNNYEVIYDTNTPTGCTLPSITSEEHFIYQNVTKKTNELSCEGYLFKGWEIDEDDAEDIKMVNSNVFVMPGHDVHIRATWAKQSIVKTMDGTVNERTTLYKVFQNEAKIGRYAREYTGAHQDSMDISKSTKKIYYFPYGSNTVGNVIFAGQCWQMIRTTDTGGVKMIYNGEVEDGKCLNTRGTHEGYAQLYANENLASNYWYGTDYIYDSTNKTFKVSGTTEQARFNSATASGLIGKYTCKSASVDGTCSILYLVHSYISSSYAHVLRIKTDSHYSQFGQLQFNMDHQGISYGGYMHKKDKEFSSPSIISSTEIILSSSSLSTSYWYANSATWGSPIANRYNLDSPYKVSSTTDYPNLVGKYTFRSATETYTNTNLYYVAVVKGSNMYYIQLSNSGNHTLADFNYTYTYGDSYTDNGDGTYTVTNQDGSHPTTIERKDWYTGYSNAGAGKYVCKNAVNNTCSDLRYTVSTTNTEMRYIRVDYNYKYASDVTWDGSKFILSGDIVNFWNLYDSANINSLNSHHYTCQNESGECTLLNYYYYIDSSKYYKINLSGEEGVLNVEDAINNMLFASDENSTNSTIKSGVDAWYKHTLLNYDDYIEDTIFCNDRSIRDLAGWNPNGGSIRDNLKFKGYYLTTDLSCINETDKFSVSNPQAKLTYKVGLMSSSEMNLLSQNARNTGVDYWLMSPSYYLGEEPHNYSISNGGYFSASEVSIIRGVRPVISLRPGIEYSDGDGSMENPYIVDLDSIYTP